jgi:hypothetical protein
LRPLRKRFKPKELQLLKIQNAPFRSLFNPEN